MARITLKCDCGWTFFIPDTTQGYEQACPRCRVMIPIPGRVKGQPVLTAVELALQVQRKAAFQRNAIYGAVGIGLVALVGWAISALVPSTRSPDEEEGAPSAGGRSGQAPSRRVILTAPVKTEPILSTPTAPQGPSGATIDEWKRDLYHHVQLVQLAGVVSEVFRLRNLVPEHEAMILRLGRLEERISALQTDLSAAGVKAPLEARFAAGDRIIAFSQKDLTQLRPLDAARPLATFLQTFRAGLLEMAVVLRGGAQVPLYLHFPDETKELLQLARHPALLSEPQAPVAPAAALPADPDQLTEVPPELLKAVTDRLSALPPGYRGFIAPEDLAHLEALQIRKQGTARDLAFLKIQLLELTIPRFEAEQARLRSRMIEIQAKLNEGGSTDVIHFNDGRKVEGKVLPGDGPDVRVKSRFGVVSIPKADIKKVDQGSGSSGEFPERLKAAGTDIPKLVLLMDWCKEKGLPQERDYIACKILSSDAGHERSRRELGMPKPSASGTPASGASAPSGPPSAETVVRQIEIAAAEVSKQFASFSDVVEQMKARTQGLKVATSPALLSGLPQPLQSLPSAAHFRPADLSVQDLRTIGAWWSGQNAGDRQAFARWFGLACAFAQSVTGN